MRPTASTSGDASTISPGSCSSRRTQCSSAPRRTSSRRPMYMAGRGDALANFPAIALHTWVLSTAMLRQPRRWRRFHCSIKWQTRFTAPFLSTAVSSRVSTVPPSLEAACSHTSSLYLTKRPNLKYCGPLRRCLHLRDNETETRKCMANQFPSNSGSCKSGVRLLAR